VSDDPLQPPPVPPGFSGMPEAAPAPTAPAPAAPMPAPPAAAAPLDLPAAPPPLPAAPAPGAAPPAGAVPPPPPRPPPGGASGIADLPPPPPPPPGGASGIVDLGPPPAVPAMPAATPAAVAPTPAVAPSIRWMDAVCVDVVRRTADCSTLYFFVGDTGPYRAGQFISIDPKDFPELERFAHYLGKMKGKKENVRAYSMSSIPSEKCVSITVKAEPYDPEHDPFPPLLSPFLASGVLKGRECRIKGFSGPYWVPDDIAEKTDQIVHVVAGSGVVPNYAILKDELINNKNPNVKHTFIDVNKTYDDIIFRDQIQALADAYPDRVELVHMITREDDPSVHGPHFFKGRPNAESVGKYVRDPSSAYVYACGPAITKYEKKKAKEEGYEPKPRFMESVHDIVHALGIDKSRFKKEEFG
jgi:3-ketosteroid 9alpha-monooxygenase subunit B